MGMQQQPSGMEQVQKPDSACKAWTGAYDWLDRLLLHVMGAVHTLSAAPLQQHVDA